MRRIFRLKNSLESDRRNGLSRWVIVYLEEVNSSLITSRLIFPCEIIIFPVLSRYVLVARGTAKLVERGVDLDVDLSRCF